MTDIALRVDHLSKQFRIGRQERYKTFRDAVSDMTLAPVRRAAGLLRGNPAAAANLSETIWALRDVSFEVKHGEVVGIIGRNGAGKSTLLKVLSRITEPTTGHADVYGRIGALLEVGTGFHPELTGRENIYLNGAILGMSREEIQRKFDEIVDFAGVEKFIDTPVKHYSSGMGLRLGFAVAAHLEPEILIVDEVLAVGDAEFQKKCMGKMSQVAGEGRTVLFVSHNMAAVQSLCQTAILLAEGKVILQDQAPTIVRAYLAPVEANVMQQRVWTDETAPGNENARLLRTSIKSSSGEPITDIQTTTPLAVEIIYESHGSDAQLSPSVNVHDSNGALVLNSAPVHETEWFGKPHPSGEYRSICHIPGYFLNTGIYRIDILLVENQSRVICRLADILAFEVKDSLDTRGTATWFGRWEGIVHPNLEWHTVRVS